jgi:site-specific DNA-methyltransferase (adenine-specific)
MTLPKPYFDDGRITIYHGDCREVLPQLSAEFMVTDPPYGMGFQSSRGGAFGVSSIDGDLDTRVRDEVLIQWAGRPALVFGRWSVPRPASTRMVLIWEKGEHVGMGDLSLPWKPNTEEIYVLGSGFEGTRTTSVLRHLAIAGTVGRAGDGSRLHPTEKPVGLMYDLLSKIPANAVVVDPFMGSGPVLRAAKDSGRRAIGVEIEERYCEIAVERLAQEVLAI